MDRYETILRNRRRRDNICDYIRGLHKSECWPYPNGASRSTPVTEQGKDGLKKVELRSDKITELMELFLINVDRQHPLAMNRYWHRGSWRTFISSSVEEGSGAYAVSHENVDRAERAWAPTLNLREVAAIHFAFIHRYEWVMDKLESVNSDRTAASEYWDEDIVSESSESDDEREEGVPRLEAVDFDACLHRDYACILEDEDEEEDKHVAQEEVMTFAQHRVVGWSSTTLASEAAADGRVGCERGFVLSAMPQDGVGVLEDVWPTDASETTVADESDLGGKTSRKRAPEISVEL